jgi:hypothetical protein
MQRGDTPPNRTAKILEFKKPIKKAPDPRANDAKIEFLLDKIDEIAKADKSLEGSAELIAWATSQFIDKICGAQG